MGAVQESVLCSNYHFAHYNCSSKYGHPIIASQALRFNTYSAGYLSPPYLGKEGSTLLHAGFICASFIDREVSLPVDPSLGPGVDVTLPSLRAGADLLSLSTGLGSGKGHATVVAEGIPLIPVKILERIRRWEFVDLATLLNDPTLKAEDMAVQQQGQVVLFQSLEQAHKCRKQIQDISTWIQAFALYMAALASDESTSKEETVGLIAHMHLINQLAREMGGRQWLKYDTDYREWAAAKGIRKWGELNLTIYGRCLTAGWGTPSAHAISTSERAGPRPRPGMGKRNKPHQTGKACFQWNFDGSCPRIDCCYTHCCFYCGEAHRAEECSCRNGKRPCKEIEKGH